MPLFTLPNLPDNPTIVTATIPLTALNGAIPAGTTYFAEGLTSLIQDGGFNGLPSFANAGTVWGRGTLDYVIKFQNINGISNSGLIVSEAANSNAHALIVSSSFYGGLNNSGGIYAVSLSGNARAIEEWGGATINNSGIIGARGTQYATAINAANGGVLNNLVGGEILAEGANATVYSGISASIVNDGRMAAVSTDPSNSSVGIILGGPGSLTNRGTISADFAFYAYDYWVTPTQRYTHTITNELSGLINGDIWMGMGDDILTNRGQIQGFIGMGEHDDLVDNSAGRITGSTDLGFGNDRYLGGQDNDFAFGDRGDDDMRGSAGNDLLVGGRGSDILSGDAGADALYGDFGDDQIITLAGDKVSGGAGDDRIELGDYAFSIVAGDDGWDRLVLPAGARTIDLQAVIATGRLSGIEVIDLASNKSLTVRGGDPAALSGGTALWLNGTASDAILLVGGWTVQGTSTREGVVYQGYTLANETVWIAGQVAVSVVTSAGAGTSGLDAVPVSLPPPILGDWGVTTSASSSVVDFYVPEAPFMIDPDEHWTSAGTGAMIYGGGNSEITTFANYGTLAASRTAIAGRFLQLDNFGTIEVSSFTGTSHLADYKSSLATYGAIRLENIGSAIALVVDLGGPSTYIANHLDISVETDEAGAIGISSYMLDNFFNYGTLTAVSRDFAAIGVSAHNGGRIENSGSITATGAVLAHAIFMSTFPGTIINSGTISANVSVSGGESVAIQGYWQSGTNRIENSGLIEGAVAIRTSINVNGGATHVFNTGQIVGVIEFHFNSTGGQPTDDIVINQGSINGQVRLGGGNDWYDGTGGTQIGSIFGDAGLDRLIGTAGADTLDGGADDDILHGGGGDNLTGGSGRDTFVFAAIGPTIEQITDFVSGSDRINLGMLAPASVSIQGNQVVVQTAQGTLRIQVSGPIVMSDIQVTTAALTGSAGADALVAAGAAGTVLSGLGGDDLLLGQQGNDRLDGGDGADWMAGSAGDDTYVMSYGDRAIELIGGGYDTIEVPAGGSPWQMPDNVERLTGGSGLGNSLDNVMVGSELGDSLNGGAGADHMTGGLGNDYYYIDNPGDMIVESLNEGTDTIASWINLTLGENLENLQLASTAAGIGIGNALDNDIAGNSGSDQLFGAGGNDFLHGHYGNDSLYGDDGNDRLEAGYGDDLLEGGAGDDVLEGWAGADTLYGGDGNDRIYANYSPLSVPADPYAGAGWVPLPNDAAFDRLFGGAGNDELHGNDGANALDGEDGHDWLDGRNGSDTMAGGQGNDSLTGGSNVDTAVFAGNRATYVITQTSTGVFQLVGPDGTDTLTTTEYAQFADQTLRLLPGAGTAVNFSAPASTWMGSIRDFDGNDLGAASGWKLIGSADVDGDGDQDRVLVNPTIGRFAEVATGPDGLVYFSDYSWAGETRVVGIYIDPLVTSGQVVQGGPFDSQRRFQNDLLIDNIAGVLGAGDYDRDGLQEVYFRLTDGTAYLHAYMHADGNIRYANYQSQSQVIDFLTANSWASSTWAGWFPAGAEAPPKAAGFAGDSFGFDEIELASIQTTYADDGMARWAEDHFAMQPLV